ncbi:PAS domain-containing sensor histidine kinase [Sphingobium yanoikuyae]|nr:ATP-binding protein [Sphingobium yanoikuyae]
MAVAAIELDVTDLLQVTALLTREPDEREEPVRLLGLIRLVLVNRAALELLGWPEAAVRGLTPLSMFPDADRGAFLDIVASAGASDGVVRREGRMRRIDGDPCSVIFTARVSQRVGSKVRVAVQCTDLRGLRSAKDATADTVALQRTLFRNLPLGLCRVNGDRLSPFYEELGVDCDTDLAAFFGANPRLLERAADLCIIEDVNPEAVRILGAGSAEELVGGSVAFAWRSRPDVFIKTLIAGMQARNHECETELDMLDGGKRDIILASASVREDGRRASIIGMVDIGDRVAAQADLIRLQAQFAQSYRLSLLTELSSWFAHEISQPLVAIATMATTGSRWLEKDAPQIDEARHAFDRILSSAIRSRGIIDRLRCMAMNHAPVQAPQRMREVVTAAMQLVEGDAKAAGVAIATRLVGCDDCVSMDRAQIGQVVVNLLMNAIEAVDRSACVVREVAIDIVVDDNCVECSVSDSGPGIAASDVANAFAELVPGAAGRAGFGLTISRSIVALHQGTLTLDGTSALGGAKISFRLPRAQAAGRPPIE